MPVELHCHTTASDGQLTPTELVDRALALGITSLAITDHDTVAGIEEALEVARPFSIRIISGVELSCHYEGQEVHLLGYFFEHRDPMFLELLENLQAERRERVNQILEKLAKAGVSLSYEEVEQETTGEVLGRPHIAKALVKTGQATSISQAFDRYIGNRAVAYVGRSLLSLDDGIEALRRAGGVSVLAHPGVYGNWPLVEEIVRLPLNGIEAWHPSHKKAERKRAKRLGARYSKILTGGSDFHHPGTVCRELGSAPITERVVSRLQNAAQGVQALG